MWEVFMGGIGSADGCFGWFGRRRNIDMRYRFRGNNPLGTAQELHQSQESVPQLYGGRPALPPMPGTNGDDDQKKE
ncbi:hypothetical protein TWF718_008366 [Orbilia javanica]|uniref:Uncharacterized protein n=1 Tax=Orbilia javanica TaxID=47235 RepID=A0AAN8RD23_9PEZI